MSALLICWIISRNEKRKFTAIYVECIKEWKEFEGRKRVDERLVKWRKNYVCLKNKTLEIRKKETMVASIKRKS